MKTTDLTTPWFPVHCSALSPPGDHEQGSPALTGPLRNLLASLHGPPGSPHLAIVGGRGSGKSWLLRQVERAVDSGERLRERWLPLRASSDPMALARPSELWVGWLEALAERLQRDALATEAAAIRAVLAALPSEEASRARAALWSLGAWAEQGRGLLLLLDPAPGLGLDELEALAAQLGAHSGLRLLATARGAPSAELAGFMVHGLAPLDVEQARSMMLHLAERHASPGVSQELARHPERFEALIALGGASPRTLVSLHRIMVLHPDLPAERAFEALLDQATPVYEAKLLSLPRQARALVLALARAWDPCTAARLAELCAMDVNKVSAQLVRLRRAAVVEKTTLHASPRTGFQLADRTFALWCLACSSPQGRDSVRWLVGFLAQPDAPEPPAPPPVATGRGSKPFRSRPWPRGGLDRSSLLVDDLGTVAGPARPAPELRAARWLDMDPAPVSESSLRDRLTAQLEAAAASPPTACWSDCRPSVRSMVAAGQAEQALDALERTGLGQRWRPVREALRACVAGSDDHLLDVAPEVRAPALRALASIRPTQRRSAREPD
jgi:hypothetical protein